MKDCDSVLHLPTLIAIPGSENSTGTYVDTNIKGTLNVLQAASELGVNRLTDTTTSEIYRTALFVHITEQQPLLGKSPYLATQIAADQLAYSFYVLFGMLVLNARPINKYGLRQSARAVIPIIITQITSGREGFKRGLAKTAE